LTIFETNQYLSQTATILSYLHFLPIQAFYLETKDDSMFLALASQN